MPQLNGYVVTQTTKAVLFWDHFWHGPLWLPKSQMHEWCGNPDSPYVEVQVVITDWIANKQEPPLYEFTERMLNAE